MICFRDQMFCETSVREGCANSKCFRNYTDELRKLNEVVDLPLSVADCKTDDCGFEAKTSIRSVLP